MSTPRILIVNMFVPAGDSHSPQYNGEWRDGYELAIALAHAGADVTLLNPRIGKHEAAVRREIEAPATAAGVTLRYANFVLNRRIGSYMTIRLTLAWLWAYYRLQPNLIIFKQARPEFGLLLPGIRAKSLILAFEMPDDGTLPPPPKEDSRLIYRQPSRLELLLNRLSLLLLRPLPRGSKLYDQYRWIGYFATPLTESTPPPSPTAFTRQNIIPMRKGYLSYPDSTWQRHNHFDPVDVVFCGAIGLRKGIFELLAAWSHVTPGATLAIIGNGPPDMEARLKEMVATLPTVRYLGSLGYFEKFALLKQAKIFVLPSKKDIYPGVIYEALSAGLPVITTRQILSQIQHGENGILVDAEDIDGLAHAINYLLTNEAERQRMAASAYQTIATHTWDSAVAQILDLAAST